MDKMYTRKDAANLLGISLATLDAARIGGLISYVQYVENGCVFFTKQVFRNILQDAPIEQNLWK